MAEVYRNEVGYVSSIRNGIGNSILILRRTVADQVQFDTIINCCSTIYGGQGSVYPGRCVGRCSLPRSKGGVLAGITAAADEEAGEI